MEEVALPPFLKWPGGKRWLISNYAHLLPTKFAGYIEPFLGGGSVFFHLRPPHATLADANNELVAAYRGIRQDWQRVERLLRGYQEAHGVRHYYSIRASRPKTLVERAARLLYLNRTSFNGIYRVNRAGEFNVPKGDRCSVLLPTDNFRKVSALLRRVKLQTADFEDTISQARRGDLIFADPPYTVRHDNNGFLKYNKVLFSWEDQERLAGALDRARARGAIVVATNANHQSVRELYKDLGFQFTKVSRFSAVSADRDSRRAFHELVIRSHSE